MDNFPITKISAFLGCLTYCEMESKTVKDFVLEYYEDPKQNIKPKCESLLGEIDFVKKLVQYAVLKKYIRRVHAHVLSIPKR